MQNIIQRTASGLTVVSLDTANFDRRLLSIRDEINQVSFEVEASSVHFHVDMRVNLPLIANVTLLFHLLKMNWLKVINKVICCMV